MTSRANPFGAPTTCQCEQTHCDHGEMDCKKDAILNVATIYGTFKMCGTCAANLPSEYKKDSPYSSQAIEVERDL